MTDRSHWHRWDLSPAEAVALQRELADAIDIESTLSTPTLAAGCDVGYDAQSNRLIAAIVVCRAPALDVVDRSAVARFATFPYLPGLLSFREAPVVLDAFEQLRVQPEMMIVDGQGTAHPRRFGLACHLGWLLDLPTIGCAKSRLTGSFREPGRARGCRARLLDKGETIGYALRTRADVRTVFVSPGHRCDLASAIRVILAATRGFRLPEPTRQAHIHATTMARQLRAEK